MGYDIMFLSRICKMKMTIFSMFQVSIMQIASEKMVFIFDLIKLHGEVPDILDSCLTRILHSPRILKLGMNNLMHYLVGVYHMS